MMRFLPALLAIACLGVSPSSQLRAQQTAAPMDPRAVLAALKDIRAKQTGTVAKEKSGVLAAINAAIGDPGKTYEQAVAAVELQGQGGSDPKRAAEIRKRASDQTRDRAFVAGLRLQLVYLSLTWQRGMGAKTRDLIPALLDYTAQVNNNAEAMAGLEMIKKPFNLSESVFVPYFQAGPYINGLPEWSERPFDVEGIFQKTILPEMRRNRDPRLLDYWDAHLQSETARASASQNNLTVTRFNHIRRPTLLWGRAEDEMLLGQGDQAAADMLALIKGYPDHPDFDKWASQLEGIANAKAAPPAGEVTVGDAALATPAPSPGLSAPAASAPAAGAVPSAR